MVHRQIGPDWLELALRCLTLLVAEGEPSIFSLQLML